jgi:hypothetical protein
MYQGELNYYTKKIIESCDCLDKHCENPCPLKTICYQYISEQEKEKEKPVWRNFTERQIESAAQALFEDMLNCNWSLDISEKYTDFWTNEQKDAMRQMTPYKQQEIFIDYEDKIIERLKDKCDDWWDDIVRDNWDEEHDAINELYGWGNNLNKIQSIIEGES